MTSWSPPVATHSITTPSPKVVWRTESPVFRVGRAAAGVQVHGPLTQGVFLRRLGIEARAAVLLRAATPEQVRDIETALQRLLDRRQMGEMFKALALTPIGSPPPAAFERRVAAHGTTPGTTQGTAHGAAGGTAQGSGS